MPLHCSLPPCSLDGDHDVAEGEDAAWRLDESLGALDLGEAEDVRGLVQVAVDAIQLTDAFVVRQGEGELQLRLEAEGNWFGRVSES